MPLALLASNKKDFVGIMGQSQICITSGSKDSRTCFALFVTPKFSSSLFFESLMVIVNPLKHCFPVGRGLHVLYQIQSLALQYSVLHIQYYSTLCDFFLNMQYTYKCAAHPSWKFLTSLMNAA